MQKEIKEHFAKYRNIYITAGIVVLASAVTGFTVYFGVKAQGLTTNKISIKGNKNQNITLQTGGVLNYTIKSNRKGPPSWMVRCIETGEIFSSQKKAAKAMEIDPRKISQNVRGLITDIKGLHFERVALSA